MRCLSIERTLSTKAVDDLVSLLAPGARGAGSHVGLLPTLRHVPVKLHPGTGVEEITVAGWEALMPTLEAQGGDGEAVGMRGIK